MPFAVTMQFQTRCLIEGFVAIFAGENTTIVRMAEPLVFLQSRPSLEPSLAVRTFERPHLRVHAHMQAQRGRGFERLRALCAPVTRSVTRRVSNLMLLQVNRVFESQAALRTLVLKILGMRPHVKLVLLRVFKRFAALFAFISAGRRMLALVVLEAFEAGKGSFTMQTLEIDLGRVGFHVDSKLLVVSEEQIALVAFV